MLSVSYTEWEDVVALSSAIAPGGKMLGLSSTRKLIATLHESVYDRRNMKGEASIVPQKLKIWELSIGDRSLKGGEMSERERQILWGNTSAMSPRSQLASVGMLTMPAGGGEFFKSAAFLDCPQPRHVMCAATSAVHVYRLVELEREDDGDDADDGNDPFKRASSHGAVNALEKIAELEAHAGEISAAKTERTLVVTGDTQGNLQAWRWSVESLKEGAQARATTDISDDMQFEYLGRHAVHADDVTGIALYFFQGSSASVLSVSHDAVMCVHVIEDTSLSRIQHLDMSLKGGMTTATAIEVAVPPERARDSRSMLPSLTFVAGETASGSYVIQSWNVEARQLLSTLQHHASVITDLKFGPLNNGPLVSGSLDGTVVLWGMSGEALKAVDVGAPVLDLEIEPHFHVWYGTEDGHLCAYRV